MDLSKAFDVELLTWSLSKLTFHNWYSFALLFLANMQQCKHPYFFVSHKPHKAHNFVLKFLWRKCFATFALVLLNLLLL
jgi:hypothetical protein